MPVSAATANIGPNVGVAPSLNVTLTAGQIVDLPMGEKRFEADRTYITNRDAHVRIDVCASPVTIRSYAIVAAHLTTAEDSVVVYGDRPAVTSLAAGRAAR